MRRGNQLIQPPYMYLTRPVRALLPLAPPVRATSFAHRS